MSFSGVSGFPLFSQRAVFSRNQKLILCNSYFKGNVIAKPFLNHLNDKEPDILLDSIRFAKLPYRPRHWSSMQDLSADLKAPVPQYMEYMAELKELDDTLFHMAATAQSDLNPGMFGVILCTAAVWLEDRSYQLKNSEDGHLIAALGLFLESYSKSHKVDFGRNFKEAQNQIAETTRHEFDTALRDSVLKAIDAWYTWHMFKISLWDTFFFDANFGLCEDNRTLRPKRLEDYFNWKEKTERYWELNEYYFSISEDYAAGVAVALAKNGLPKDGMAEQVAAMHLYAADLCVDQMKSPKILELIWAVARERYLSGVHTNRIVGDIATTANTTAIHRRLMEIDGRIMPVRVYSKTEASDWTSKFLPDDTEDVNMVVDQVLNKMSTDCGTSTAFNRHRPDIDLLAFPFTCINGVYVLFPSVAGRQVAVYSIANMTLGKGFGSEELGKISSEIMENRLAELFGQLNGSKPLYGSEFWPKNDRQKLGDIDFAWVQGGNFYVFQLKRGKMRLDLEMALQERLGSLQVAVEQIQLASNQLADFQNEISNYLAMDLVLLNVVPIVVHTSFEASYEMIEGVPVINYFDLLRMLTNKRITAEVMDEWLKEKTCSPWLVSGDDLSDYPAEKLDIMIRLPEKQK
jgi:hypothetical protein